MAEKKTPSTSGNTAAGIAAVAAILPLVKPVVEAGRDYIDKAVEERKKLVSVPELYSKDYPITVEQAVEMLESCGLKATLVKTPAPDIRYRDYFDSQVTSSNPKAKQKVERGTSVMVKYVTQDVIEQSQRLFDISEKRKIEMALEKEKRRSEQKEKAKQRMSNMLDTVKQETSKVSDAIRKKKGKEDPDE